MPFSTTPWSNFSESDYSLQQWDSATLIHLVDPLKVKGDGKLPVKEPGGTYNVNGIHAAAGVLAGARGGVNAPRPLKAKAARKLMSLYREMKETPPASLYKVTGDKLPAQQ